MNKEGTWGFHGELAFERVLPCKHKGKELKTNVLQKSTQDNHDHIIVKGVYKLSQLGPNKMLLFCKKGVVIGMRISKERHKDCELPNNSYWIVGRMLESDHFNRVIRQLAD